MMLPDPSLAAARSLVLDYFRGMRAVVPESHLLLHEGTRCGPAELRLLTQLCRDCWSERAQRGELRLGLLRCVGESVLPLLHREWTLAAGMGIDGWGATDTHAGVHTGRETVSAMHAVAHMLLLCPKLL